MLHQKSCIEVKGNNDRMYGFYTEPSAPLGEVYDALHTMMTHVLKLMHDRHEQEKKCQEKDNNCEQEA